MIRINLLPVRQIKKRIEARNTIIGLGIALFSVLAVLGLIALFLGFQVGELKASISDLNKEKKKYQTTINQIEKLKKDQTLLETKLNTISQLKKGSKLTVRVLDEMANLVPSTRLWVKTMSFSGASLRLSGIALDNATIADFMDAITGSAYFATAELSGTSNARVSGRNLKSFSLTCRVVNPADKPEETEEQKGEKKKK